MKLQSYQEIEHIFVDGGSCDDTVEIINSNSIIERKIISEKDYGIYDAINKGIKVSKGEYILLLHSDDKLYDNKVIENMVHEIAKNSFPDILSGSVVHVKALNNMKGKYIYRSKSLNRLRLLFGFIPAHNGSFVKRESYSTNLYNRAFKSAGDFEWFLRMYKNSARYKATGLIVAQQRLGGKSSSGWKSYYLSTSEQMLAFRTNKMFPCLFCLICRLPIKYLGRLYEKSISKFFEK